MGDYVAKYTCGTCDEYEYKGQYEKGYCNRYRAYYYHDESCSHWVEGNNQSYGSGGCFITTACCEYMGFDDNCTELAKLRHFRDNYLLNNDVGKELVQSYYRIAPKMVEKINAREDKDIIYKEIYQRIVRIVNLINTSANEDAIVEYIRLILFAQEKA
jgi:hypothetical protein